MQEDPSSEAGERLAKRVAAQLHCSRREAEQLVAQGAVTVDGEAATQPQQRVRPEQHVAVAPGARPQAMAPATLLVHKPAGLDWEAPGFWARLQRDAHDALHGRPAVPGLFMGQRCVAPLGPQESGLLVFSQVPGVARRLLDDAPLVEHEFSVELGAAVAPDQLARLRPARASISRQTEELTGLRVVLHGPEPGQIAALCQRAGLAPILALRRLRIGRLSMAGLAPGHWRCLRTQERF
ncbi:RNA pseudouridine synthase [Xenophilus arseniciresistens]|uniref:Dual-specificity RNA pseudouridine synthase RluF n=1 Tax=Xenophilus arseniciresistens TaxID=1283306 RepID=A0AAE3NAB6_9BURK|nr:RNA pseudouridine synthase [Xenophilus arseniciresistens]MDA7417858.1 RNA pseudouridine synthase [Xenophilus arseniciresistens]